jgi:hypothetical protein
MQSGCYLNCDGRRGAVVRARLESLCRNEPDGEVAQAGVIRSERLNVAGNAILVDNGRELDHSVELSALLQQGNRNIGWKQGRRGDAGAGVVDSDVGGLCDCRFWSECRGFLASGESGERECDESDGEFAAQKESPKSMGKV